MASPEPELTIRYAETEPDMTAIHRFLLVVARPAMHGGVDGIKSLLEVIRVVRDECALMLMKGDVLVGTMGMMKATWWYNNTGFMTDRWHFVLPEHMHSPGAAALLDEAVSIANGAGLEFIHQGKIRRGKPGLGRAMPRAYPPESVAQDPEPDPEPSATAPKETEEA